MKISFQEWEAINLQIFSTDREHILYLSCKNHLEPRTVGIPLAGFEPQLQLLAARCAEAVTALDPKLSAPPSGKIRALSLQGVMERTGSSVHMTAGPSHSKRLSVTIPLSLSAIFLVLKGQCQENSPGETCRAPGAWPWLQTGLSVCPPPWQPGGDHGGMSNWGRDLPVP